MQEEKPLTVKQEKAIQALLVESTIERAAIAAGVSERVLYNWLKEELFSKAYQDARSTIFNNVVETVQACSKEAIEVLRAIMNNSEERGSTRVLAARSVMEFGFRSYELMNLIKRIESIEGKLNADSKD